MSAARKPMTVTEYYNKMSNIIQEIGEVPLRAELAENKDSKDAGCVADQKGNSVFRWGFEHNRPHNKMVIKKQVENLTKKIEAYDEDLRKRQRERRSLSPSH